MTPRLKPAPLWSVASCRSISSHPRDQATLTRLCADRCCVMIPNPPGVDLRCERVCYRLRSSVVRGAASTSDSRADEVPGGQVDYAPNRGSAPGGTAGLEWVPAPADSQRSSQARDPVVRCGNWLGAPSTRRGTRPCLTGTCPDPATPDRDTRVPFSPGHPLTHVVQRAGLSGTMTTTGTRTQSGATALARPIGRCRPEPFAINPTAREVEGCQLTHGVTIVPARLTWLRVATTTVAQC